MTEDETETPAETSSATTTLTLDGPSWCTGMRLTVEDGSTLLVTRQGAEVPAEQAQALIDIAAKHGVTLRSN